MVQEDCRQVQFKGNKYLYKFKFSKEITAVQVFNEQIFEWTCTSFEHTTTYF
jgi:hypothetical protein